MARPLVLRSSMTSLKLNSRLLKGCVLADVGVQTMVGAGTLDYGIRPGLTRPTNEDVRTRISNRFGAHVQRDKRLQCKSSRAPL
jgi:hypothetical protein